MQGWGITGILLILFIIIVFVYILKFVVRSAINESEFKRSVDNDLKKIKEDINNITEILKSKNK